MLYDKQAETIRKLRLQGNKDIMGKNNGKFIAGNIIMTLAFVVIAGIVFTLIWSSVGSLALTRIDMAVNLGAPVYEYEDYGEQPSEGTLSKSDILLPSVSSKYGSIRCDRIDLKAPLYYGDSDSVLGKGAGHYTGSGLPGEGRSILIGAHDLGYFAPLELVEKGDIIALNTSYGEFTYEVSDIEIKAASSYGMQELDSDEENLILYTCYPFGSVTEDTADRYFVIAQKITGPVLVEK